MFLFQPGNALILLDEKEIYSVDGPEQDSGVRICVGGQWNANICLQIIRHDSPLLRATGRGGRGGLPIPRVYVIVDSGDRPVCLEQRVESEGVTAVVVVVVGVAGHEIAGWR